MTTLITEPRKIRRAELPAGEVLCSYCTAKCCRYFALPVDAPVTRADYDNFRWYMLHGRVGFFVEDGTWFLMVFSNCNHLQDDHRCGIYETRPKICRDYSADACEFDDDALYDMYFETPEQLWEYAEAVLPPTSQRKFSAKPLAAQDVLLPVV